MISLQLSLRVNVVITAILVVMRMMTLIIIMIMTAFKGAVGDLLQSSRYAVNCLQHLRSSSQGTTVCKSRATQPAPITCNVSCATWYDGTAQLLSLTELKSHLL